MLNTPKIHNLHTNTRYTPRQGNNGMDGDEEKLHYHDRCKAAKGGGGTDQPLNRQRDSSKAVACHGPAAVMDAEKLWFGDCGGMNNRGWRWSSGRGIAKVNTMTFQLGRTVSVRVTISVVHIFFVSNLVNSWQQFFYLVKLSQLLLCLKYTKLVQGLFMIIRFVKFAVASIYIYIWRKKKHLYLHLQITISFRSVKCWR